MFNKYTNTILKNIFRSGRKGWDRNAFSKILFTLLQMTDRLQAYIPSEPFEDFHWLTSFSDKIIIFLKILFSPTFSVMIPTVTLKLQGKFAFVYRHYLFGIFLLTINNLRVWFLLACRIITSRSVCLWETNSNCKRNDLKKKKTRFAFFRVEQCVVEISGRVILSPTLKFFNAYEMEVLDYSLIV